MNLGAVLITGLVAGGISCAAVQGGLLAGLVTRQRERTPTRPDRRPKAKAGQPRPAPPSGTVHKSKQARRKAHQAQQRWKVHTVEPPKSMHLRAWDGLKSLRGQAAEDFLPVGAFLGGKLASHALLGALLGAIGGAVQLSPAVRTWTQLAAGALIIAFGLAQLGVGPFKRLTIEPPAAWTRFVRGRARSQAAFAPALLGFVTILVPCGVTLSVEALALTSGSAWAGATTMAVFVIGTGPLFAILGYAARRAATAWRGRLALVTGLVVLGMGLYTFNGGLTLADSPLAASNLPQTLGLNAPPAVATTVTTDAGRQTAVLTARARSYSPANIQIKAGVPTTLVVRSQNNSGCTRAFVIRGKQYVLPVTGDTEIDLGVLEPGELRYRCGMGMYSGRITAVTATAEGTTTR